MKKLLSVLLVLALLIGGFVGYVFFDNSKVKTTNYEVSSTKIPKQFDGYKIAVVSDFHNGKNGDAITSALIDSAPDIICLTGDLVDLTDTDFTNVRELIQSISDIAPIYSVYGNHEQNNLIINNLERPAVYDTLINLGVNVLENQITNIYKDGAQINLVGYKDNNFDDTKTYFKEKAKNELTTLCKTIDNNIYTVCLIHRGQYFDYLSDVPGIDLYLSGHLHGGLVNIPKLREKVLLEHFGTDKYSKGIYFENDKTAIISAGLESDNGIPRVFNTPEVVVVELKSK